MEKAFQNSKTKKTFLETFRERPFSQICKCTFLLRERRLTQLRPLLKKKRHVWHRFGILLSYLPLLLLTQLDSTHRHLLSDCSVTNFCFLNLVQIYFTYLVPYQLAALQSLSKCLCVLSSCVRRSNGR